MDIPNLNNNYLTRMFLHMMIPSYILQHFDFRLPCIIYWLYRNYFYSYYFSACCKHEFCNSLIGYPTSIITKYQWKVI